MFNLDKFINKKVLVLPEIYKDGYLIGHTDNYLKIRVKGNHELLNKIIEVKVLKNSYPYLDGELVK